MAVCTPKPMLGSSLNRRLVEMNFNGGNVTSDGGGILLREAEKKIGLLERLKGKIKDPRNPLFTTYSAHELLRQRVMGIALGYEDLNDHESLRHDIAFQTAVGTTDQLAGDSTLCRFENWIDRKTCLNIHEALLENFFSAYSKPPKAITLDLDATDSLIHGEQKGRHFQKYYGGYCFLPLYVFAGKHLLVAYLRSSDHDGAWNASAVMKILCTEIKKRWPKVKITIRGDSGFCRIRLMYWCEKNDIRFIFGISSNSRLKKASDKLAEEAEGQFDKTGKPQKLFESFQYGAEAWDAEYLVVCKAEHTELGANRRFVITNGSGGPEEIYCQEYCPRGEMENGIKQQKLFVYADRTSCHEWMANQFRLLLSALSYTLVEAIRTIGLIGTELASAQIDTIRLRLLRIGAVVTRNTRRIKLMLSSSYPYKEIFQKALSRLSPG